MTDPRKIIWSDHTPEQISALVAEAYGVEPQRTNWRLKWRGKELAFDTAEDAKAMFELWVVSKTAGPAEVISDPVFKPYATSVDACLELVEKNEISLTISKGFLWEVKIWPTKKSIIFIESGVAREKSLPIALCIALLRHKGVIL